MAGTFARLGCGAPKSLMGPLPENARGFYESSKIAQFDDELLASAGSNWADWRAFNPHWRHSPVAAGFRERARRLFHDEFQDQAFVVFKDPRVCRLAPFWFEVLGEIGAEARVAMPIRSPWDVAQSLKRRNGFPTALGMAIWLRHVLEAEAETRTTTRTIFALERFLSDWRTGCDQIAVDLNIAWPRLSDLASRDIDEFLTKDLIHHGTPRAELERLPEIHEWCLLAYDALLELAVHPSSNSALTTLDELRAKFDQAAKLFGRVLIDYERDLENARGLERTASAERDDLRVREQNLLAQTAATLNERALTMEELEKARAEAQFERDALAQRLEEAMRDKEAIARVLDQTVQDKDAMARSLDEAVCDKEALVLVLDEAERVKGALALSLEDAGREKDALTRCLDEALASAGEKAARAERASQDSGNLVSEHQTLRAEFVDVHAELAAKKALQPPKGMAAWLRLKHARRRRRQAAQLLKSGIFDAKSYRASYLAASPPPPNAVERDLAAAMHYLEEGFCRGFRPNEIFDTRWYLERYPDVRSEGVNPLLHYLTIGFREGRDPGPEFSTSYYLEANPDVRDSGLNPLVHYRLHGHLEGRRMSRPVEDLGANCSQVELVMYVKRRHMLTPLNPIPSDA